MPKNISGGPKILTYFFSRNLPEGPEGTRGGGNMSQRINSRQGVPGGQGGHLGDPLGPSSWFDESSDYS